MLKLRWAIYVLLSIIVGINWNKPCVSNQARSATWIFCYYTLWKAIYRQTHIYIIISLKYLYPTFFLEFLYQHISFVSYLYHVFVSMLHVYTCVCVCVALIFAYIPISWLKLNFRTQRAPFLVGRPGWACKGSMELLFTVINCFMGAKIPWAIWVNCNDLP